MTIAVESYCLPTAADLPRGRLSWLAQPERAALLVHDMQEYFLRFYAAEQEPMTEAMHNMQTLLAACRRRGIPVVFSVQPADPAEADRKLLADLWGPGLTAFPQQASIVPQLLPRATDLILKKTRYSAFHQTELRSYLHEQGRDQLWICGVYAHIGCMITAFDAFMNDIKPFLVMDAVMDFSRGHHELAGRLVSERCGVLTTSDQLLRRMQTGNSQTDWARHAVLVAIARLTALDEREAVPEAELRDLGLDSVRMMELIELLRADGVAVESVNLLECQTLGQLYEAVRRAPLQDAAAHEQEGAPE